MFLKVLVGMMMMLLVLLMLKLLLVLFRVRLLVLSSVCVVFSGVLLRFLMLM